MSVSRYRNLNTLENGKYLETPNPISQKDISKIKTFNIRITSEDRLDTLAAKYLGSRRILVHFGRIE